MPPLILFYGPYHRNAGGIGEVLSLAVRGSKMALLDIARSDFKAAVHALDDKDYFHVQIFGNRLISNTLLEDSAPLALVGFLIRDAGIDVLSASKNPELLEKLTPLAKTLFRDLEPLAFNSKDQDLKAIWGAYFAYADRAREASKTKAERPSYSEDLTFTRATADYIFHNFYASPQYVLEPNSRLLSGTVNELERVSKCHSASPLDTITICLLFAALRLQDYIQGSIENQDRPGVIKDKLWPFMERLRNFRSKYVKEVTSEGYAESTSLLYDMLREWRHLFIRFHEPTQTITAQIPAEEGLPQELKDKVDHALMDVIKPPGKEKARE